MKNPDILLCDEPTGALDYNTSKEILKLIEDVNKKYGNTIIMVTHNEAIRNRQIMSSNFVMEPCATTREMNIGFQRQILSGKECGSHEKEKN